MDIEESQSLKSPMLVDWFKSRRSNSQGACVEYGLAQAQGGPTALMRDTQNRELGHLSVSPREWGATLKALV